MEQTINKIFFVAEQMGLEDVSVRIYRNGSSELYIGDKDRIICGCLN